MATQRGRHTYTVGRGQQGMPVIPMRIYEARKAAGFSLEQLAEGKCTKQHLSLIEQGQVLPSGGVLRHIADRTGQPLDFFFDKDGKIAGELTLAEQMVQLAQRLRFQARAIGDDGTLYRAIAKMLEVAAGEVAHMEARHQSRKKLH